MTTAARCQTKHACLFLLFLFCTHTPGLAQPGSADPRQVDLTVQTVFDSIRSDPTIYRKYFGVHPAMAIEKGAALANRVTEQLQLAVAAKFEEIALPATAQFAAKATASLDIGGNNTYLVSDTLFVDGDASLNMKVSILHLPTARRVVNFETVLKSDIRMRRDWWRELSEATTPSARIEQILDRVATSLVARIDKDIVNRILESSFKIRVAVARFKRLGAHERYDDLDLEQALRTMVEAELARSETILIFARNNQAPGSSGDKAERFYNYLIQGSFFEVENQLRIDIRCIKESSSRILTSRSVIADTIDVRTLSRKIAEVGNQLKRTMEADFKQSTKSIAVVATPPIRLFKRATKEDLTIAMEVARALLQKVKLLTVRTEEDELHLRLRVLDNRRKMEEYIAEPTEPAEMIADLNVDFLVVVSYEDLGDFVRVSTNLHSFDVERPAFAQLIAERKVKKSMIPDAINATARSLLNAFINLGYLVKETASGSLVPVSRAEFRTHIANGNVNRFKRMHSVTMPEVRRLKGFGFRAGAVAKRTDTDIFAGQNSGTYFEVFFSYLVPLARRMGIDLGFEPTFGLDLGKGDILLRGVGGMNLQLNVKLVYSGLKHADLPIIPNLPLTIGVGGGVGSQSIWYNVKPGDGIVVGDQGHFKNSVRKFATNYFAEVEFPLSDKLRFHLLFRRITDSEEISAFSKVKLDQWPDGGVTGKLGGNYLVGGLKLAWR